MSGDPSLDPLDPALARLLETERAATPPSGALDRVWGRLIVVPAPIGGGAGAGGHAAAAKGAAAWAASHVVAVGVAAFVAGGVVSGAAVMATHKRAERVVYVERRAPPAPAIAPAPPPPRVVPIVAPTPLPTVTAAPQPSAPVPTLARERALLDEARAALGGGDDARALALLDEHARKFQRAQLGEEREALAVQALVASGRYDEARARAARFRASAPDSLFLPAIDATLESIP
jgi:hypothetical protein